MNIVGDMPRDMQLHEYCDVVLIDKTQLWYTGQRGDVNDVS